jgi:hypothetical protein
VVRRALVLEERPHARLERPLLFAEGELHAQSRGGGGDAPR